MTALAAENWEPDGAYSLVRSPKTAEVIASYLRRQIIRGELIDGDRLPSESDLMSRFGVSRPSLREAFRVLESEMLLSVRRGANGGARVHAPRAEVAARYVAFVLEHEGTEVGDLYQARGVIEPACVARLARTRTDSELARLRVSLEVSRALVEDPVEQMREQGRFHLLLVDMVGNRTLTMVTGIIRHLVETTNTAHARHEAATSVGRQALAHGLRAHEFLVELLAAGDVAGAEGLWRSHLSAADEYLLGGSHALTALI